MVSHRATAARGSSGQGARRWLRNDRSTVTSQPANTSAPVPGMAKTVLVPASGNRSVALASESWTETTAGSGSTSTHTASAASAASVREVAMTTATGSPT